jgi:hypothetical protein
MLNGEETQERKDQEALGILKCALGQLRVSKPNDKSPLDRSYAIVITDMEKLLAYFEKFIKN